MIIRRSVSFAACVCLLSATRALAQAPIVSRDAHFDDTRVVERPGTTATIGAKAGLTWLRPSRFRARQTASTIRALIRASGRPDMNHMNAGRLVVFRPDSSKT